MSSLEDIIRIETPTETYLRQTLAGLSEVEKAAIDQRIEAASGYIKHPLSYPFPPHVYARLFSYLVQIELTGIMLPEVCLPLMQDNPKLAAHLRQQMLDEVFHALLFLKIAKHFSLPYAAIPDCSEGLEAIRKHVAEEDDITIALVMLHLIGECMVEDLIRTLADAGVTPEILKIVLADEHRHVNEGELYQILGKPDRNKLTQKLHQLEILILDNMLLEPRYLMPSVTLLGFDRAEKYFIRIIQSHRAQLDKFNITPHTRWQSLAENAPLRFKAFTTFLSEGHDEIDLTSTRQGLMNIWEDPNSPTMTCDFSLDVTELGFFERKFPSETIILLVLLSLSQTLAENPQWRRYIYNRKIYQTNDVLTALVIKIPGHADHVGQIVFNHCQTLSFLELVAKVQGGIEIMTYCHELALKLAAEHPELKQLYDPYYDERRYSPFEFGSFSMPIVSVSNVGSWGIERATTPLFPGESAKIVLGKIERVQAWHTQEGYFKTMDKLPVGLSVDHRAYDATEAPLSLQQTFKQVKQRFFKEQASSTTTKLSQLVTNTSAVPSYKRKIKKLIQRDLRYAYETLVLASQTWVDDANVFPEDSQSDTTSASALLEEEA